jgi:hypothetical protein
MTKDEAECRMVTTYLETSGISKTGRRRQAGRTTQLSWCNLHSLGGDLHRCPWIARITTDMPTEATASTTDTPAAASSPQPLDPGALRIGRARALSLAVPRSQPTGGYLKTAKVRGSSFFATSRATPAMISGASNALSRVNR